MSYGMPRRRYTVHGHVGRAVGHDHGGAAGVIDDERNEDEPAGA